MFAFLQSSPNPPPNLQNWSSLAGKKAPPTSWGGGQPHPHNEVAMTSSNLKGGSRPQFKIADDELDEVSFWDDCAREVKKSAVVMATRVVVMATRVVPRGERAWLRRRKTERR